MNALFAVWLLLFEKQDNGDVTHNGMLQKVLKHDFEEQWKQKKQQKYTVKMRKNTKNIIF